MANRKQSDARISQKTPVPISIARSSRSKPSWMSSKSSVQIEGWQIGRASFNSNLTRALTQSIITKSCKYKVQPMMDNATCLKRSFHKEGTALFDLLGCVIVQALVGLGPGLGLWPDVATQTSLLKVCVRGLCHGEKSTKSWNFLVQRDDCQ